MMSRNDKKKYVDDMKRGTTLKKENKVRSQVYYVLCVQIFHRKKVRDCFVSKKDAIATLIRLVAHICSMKGPGR